MIYLLLIFAVAWLIYKAHEFEPLSRLEHMVVPIYALIMFVLHMTWNLQNTIQALVIVILAFFISDYQLKDVELKVGHHRRAYPTILIKKNRSYVIGWLAVLVLGVLFNISFAQHVDSQHLVTELLQDLKKEILLITTFTTDSPWYIWLLSGLTTYLYTHRLVKRNKEMLGKEAIREMRSRKKEDLG